MEDGGFVTEPDIYKVVSGLSKVTFPTIAEGVNVTHTVVVIPRVAGYHNFSVATITYTATEGEENEQVGEKGFTPAICKGLNPQPSKDGI